MFTHLSSFLQNCWDCSHDSSSCHYLKQQGILLSTTMQTDAVDKKWVQQVQPDDGAVSERHKGSDGVGDPGQPSKWWWGIKLGSAFFFFFLIRILPDAHLWLLVTQHYRGWKCSELWQRSRTFPCFTFMTGHGSLLSLPGFPAAWPLRDFSSLQFYQFWSPLFYDRACTWEGGRQKWGLGLLCSNPVSASLAGNAHREIQEVQKMQVFISLANLPSFEDLFEGLSVSFEAGILPEK